MNLLLKTTFLLIGLFSFPTYAANLDNGSELHKDNCTRCHDKSVYTRPNRSVGSLPKLGSRVRLCQNNLGITWFDDEVEDVVHYLDKSYYHF